VLELQICGDAKLYKDPFRELYESFSQLGSGIEAREERPCLLDGLALASYQSAEGFGELEGDGTGAAFGVTMADFAFVEFHHGDDFGGGSGEEGFFSGVKIVAREGSFANGDARCFAEIKDDLAGDAIERAIGDRRGNDLAFFDDEDVVSGALGNVALLVEHEAFHGTRLEGFDFGHDVVEVVERLNLRAQARGGGSTGATGDDFEALGVVFFRVEFDARGDDEHRRSGAKVRVETKVAHATRDDETDVAFGETIRANGVESVGHDLIDGPRHLDKKGLGRKIEAFDVLAEAEDAVFVKANALEDSVTI
jgi:hypothetical protein